MSQEFSGSVRDVAGRDVVNHIHTGSSRLLTRDERRSLHKLVRQLERFGESGKETWASIHKILGTDNIETMRLEQFRAAETILQLLIANAQLRLQPGNTESEGALRAQLDQSTNALTKLIKRNRELVTNFKEFQRAFTDLDTRFKKQTADLQSVAAALECSREEAEYALSCNQAAIATAHKRLILSILVLSLATLSAVFFAYKAQVLRGHLQTTKARLTVCEYDGQPYAVGSVLQDKKAASTLECAAIADDLPPQWQAVKQKTSGRGR